MDSELPAPAERPLNPPRLRPEWLEALGDTLSGPKMQGLARFLRDEKALGKVIYPPGAEIFSALQLTPPEAVRVVILGQDPYHGPGQAHGLSFSVPREVAIPPSLRNIFKELQRDLKIDKPSHGCLSHWAEQGVLLLNASLTVEAGRAGSHQNLGWEVFTDRVIATVRDIGKPIVFMLWGAQARKTIGALEGSDHCILTAPHPSPLSAHRGFLGCDHFSQANAFLERCGRGAIDWSLPP